MRTDNQLRTAANIISEYDYSLPLHRFLIGYFKNNKKMGSRDRKTAADLIYSYFRLGGAFSECTVEERLLIGQFLCHYGYSVLLKDLQPVFNQKITLPLNEKITYLKSIYPSFELSQIAPYIQYVSPLIGDKNDYLQSILSQPKLFVRVRKGALPRLLNILKDNEIEYEQINNNCLSFKNTTKLDHLQESERLFEIQDLSSQQTAEYFEPNSGEKWWDTCAASGGKSLMLLDKEPNIELTVSDIRGSILKNLEKRFWDSGIRKYNLMQIDLTKDLKPYLKDKQFDGIILDAPCSGSGTWGRTPEMLTRCTIDKIKEFSALQKKIATNVLPYLRSGKPLIYITCSVFQEENEEIIDYLCNNFNILCVRQELIKGYHNGADSMFVARLIKQ